MRIYFAADHAGFELKNALINFVRGELGHDVEDCGAFELDPSDDYPEIIAVAARRLSADVQTGAQSKGIIIGASGQGEAMVANRFKGVRAVVYYGGDAEQTDMSCKKLDMLLSTREHNDANVLSLGARFLSGDAAKEAVQKWLTAGFSGDERHVRRIQHIDTVL